jgi:hypothetical protein
MYPSITILPVRGATETTGSAAGNSAPLTEPATGMTAPDATPGSVFMCRRHGFACYWLGLGIRHLALGFTPT